MEVLHISNVSQTDIFILAWINHESSTGNPLLRILFLTLTWRYDNLREVGQSLYYQMLTWTKRKNESSASLSDINMIQGLKYCTFWIILELWELETIASLIVYLVLNINLFVFDSCAKIQNFQNMHMAEKFHIRKCLINKKPLNILTWNLSILIDTWFYFNLR